MYSLPLSGTMASKIETSSKNIKPRINLNHKIYMFYSREVFYGLAISFFRCKTLILGKSLRGLDGLAWSDKQRQKTAQMTEEKL